MSMGKGNAYQLVGEDSGFSQSGSTCHVELNPRIAMRRSSTDPGSSGEFQCDITLSTSTSTNGQGLLDNLRTNRASNGALLSSTGPEV